jgi:orotate phosphoribosyltransferase
LLETAKAIADVLLNIKAIHINLETPFVFTSGTLSPVYVDCRKIISFVNERRTVIELASRIVKDDIGLHNIDLIAGGETAGIPFAAWLSESLDLPMIYVRKKPKNFGRHGQIEGDVKSGQKVLLVEDLIFDAGSKLNFHTGVINTGAIMEHILVIFDYGNRRARKSLEERGIKLHAMTNWSVLLQLAEKRNYVTQKEHEVIQEFLHDPEKWKSKTEGS